MLIDGLCLKEYKARIEWIDIAKGISILVILYAHVFDTGLITGFVHLFHVPVFFVLSGLVWKKAQRSKDFLLDLLKGLIIPYFIAGIVSILIYLLLGSFFSKNSMSISDCILGLFYANSRTGLMKWCRPLWFLPCLFMVKIIWELIANIKNKVIQYIIVFVVWFVAVGTLYTDIKEWKLPWELEVALHALPYYCMGVMIQRHLTLTNFAIRRRWILLPVSLLLFLLCILVFNLNYTKLSFQYNLYGNYIFFVLGAIAGTAMVFTLSMMISRWKLLEIAGQNTLIILLWHKYPILLFQLTGLGKKCCNNPDSFLSILIGLVVVIISTITSLIIGFVFSRIRNRIHLSGKSQAIRQH